MMMSLNPEMSFCEYWIFISFLCWSNLRRTRWRM